MILKEWHLNHVFKNSRETIPQAIKLQIGKTSKQCCLIPTWGSVSLFQGWVGTVVDWSMEERRKCNPLLFLPDKAANRSRHPPSIPSLIAALAWISVDTHPRCCKTDRGTEPWGLSSDFLTSGLHPQPRWAVWWPKQPAVFARTVQAPAAGTVTFSWIPSPAAFVCPVFQGCSVPLRDAANTHLQAPGKWLLLSIQRVLTKWAKTKHTLLMEQKEQGQDTFKAPDHLAKPKAGL